MPTDPALPLSVRPVELPDFTGARARVVSLRNLERQGHNLDLAARSQELEHQRQSDELLTNRAILLATQRFIRPNGTLDREGFIGALSGTPAAAKIPGYLRGFEADDRLHTEDRLKSADVFGQLAATARKKLKTPAGEKTIYDPDIMAGQFAAQSVRRQNPVAGQLLERLNSAPDASSRQDLANQIGDILTRGSEVMLQRDTATANLDTNTLVREQLVADREQKYASRTMAAAAVRGVVAYTRAYDVLSQSLRQMFDAPDDFDATLTAKHARLVGMTPAEQETEVNRDASEQALQRRLDLAQRRVDLSEQADRVRRDLERRRVELAEQAAAWREKRGTDPDGRLWEQYKLAHDDYNRSHPPVDTVTGRQVADWKPFKSYDEWVKETPAERPPVAKTTAPPVKTVTEAQLSQIARIRGTTVEVQRQRAKAAGYTVVK